MYRFQHLVLFLGIVLFSTIAHAQYDPTVPNMLMNIVQYTYITSLFIITPIFVIAVISTKKKLRGINQEDTLAKKKLRRKVSIYTVFIVLFILIGICGIGFEKIVGPGITNPCKGQLPCVV